VLVWCKVAVVWEQIIRVVGSWEEVVKSQDRICAGAGLFMSACVSRLRHLR
jgi:hypothetical protein